jgi:hypothetical protein
MRSLLAGFVALAACGAGAQPRPQYAEISTDEDGHHYYVTEVFSRSGPYPGVETVDDKRVYLPELDPDPLALAMMWVDAHANRPAIPPWPSHRIEAP